MDSCPSVRRRCARQGTDLSIFCYGYMRYCALEAAETLATQDGIQAEVVDLRTLRPLDTDAILASVARTGRALVVHEANGFGGFGGEIAATIAEHGFEHLDAPVTRLDRARGAGCPVRPRPRGLVHGQPRTHRRSRASAGRFLIG